jgi:hypothetical protein
MILPKYFNGWGLNPSKMVSEGIKYSIIVKGIGGMSQWNW